MLIKRICSQNFWKTGERGKTEGRRFLLAARELLLKEDGMRSIIQYGIACYKKDWKSRCAKITRRAVFNCAALLTKKVWKLTLQLSLVENFGLKLKKL